jgi:hypothetical protein
MPLFKRFYRRGNRIYSRKICCAVYYKRERYVVYKILTINLFHSQARPAADSSLCIARFLSWSDSTVSTRVEY